MNDTLKAAAEKAFIDFNRQLGQKQSKGFISEAENRKIFSFETYLRETGQPEEIIATWCQLAKANDFLFSTSRKPAQVLRMMGLILLWATGIALFFYLLIASLLLIFGVSLWHWNRFIIFMSVGILLVLAYLIKPYIKAKLNLNSSKSSRKTPLFVIKYFDNDELKFTKANSRLFVEK